MIPTAPDHVDANTAIVGQSLARTLTWLKAVTSALVMLAGLGWLLARLVWIYYFFGLFFFLVAGLLVGGIAFRIARRARPLPRGRLVRGIITLTIASTLITLVWEYRHFADTVAQPPKFAHARNEFIAQGRQSSDIHAEAAAEFIRQLARDHPPGGAAGYVRWAVASGKMRLTVAGDAETIVCDHRGWVWPVRTVGAALLLAAGLWFSLESLRSREAVSNVLRPGEEFDEEL